MHDFVHKLLLIYYEDTLSSSFLTVDRLREDVYM